MTRFSPAAALAGPWRRPSHFTSPTTKGPSKTNTTQSTWHLGTRAIRNTLNGTLLGRRMVDTMLYRKGPQSKAYEAILKWTSTPLWLTPMHSFKAGLSPALPAAATPYH